jgi:PBP1b-binding outer membrane lipoprotein LpoB
MKKFKLLILIAIISILLTGCIQDSRQMIVEIPQQLEVRS